MIARRMTSSPPFASCEHVTFVRGAVRPMLCVLSVIGASEMCLCLLWDRGRVDVSLNVCILRLAECQLDVSCQHTGHMRLGTCSSSCEGDHISACDSYSCPCNKQSERASGAHAQQFAPSQRHHLDRQRPSDAVRGCSTWVIGTTGSVGGGTGISVWRAPHSWPPGPVEMQCVHSREQGVCIVLDAVSCQILLHARSGADFNI